MAGKKEEEYEMKTVAQDARYHNCNCTNWCMDAFLDYYKCRRLLGEGSECCEQFSKVYKTVCPNDWVKKWLDQMENGTFPYDLPERKEDLDKQDKQEQDNTAESS